MPRVPVASLTFLLCLGAALAASAPEVTGGGALTCWAATADRGLTAEQGAAGHALTAEQPTRGRALTADQWREDLRTLARELPRVHRNAFHQVTRDSFDRAVAALDSAIPGLQDHEVIVGLARIVASVGDGHTRLALPEDPKVAFSQAHTATPVPANRALVFQHLPVKLYLYSDGLHVQAATPAWRRALGMRVLRIGRVSATEALEAVRPVVPADNEMGYRLVAPAELAIPEVLHALRLIEDPVRVPIVVADSSGREATLDLEPLPLFEVTAWVEAHQATTAAGTHPATSIPVPLWRHDPGNEFWLSFDPRSRALYVQVNRVADKPGESLAQFAARLSEFIERNPVERLVLDLRLNAGGNNDLNRSLVLALARSPKVNQPGRLFVIIGRATFSAGVTLASQLEYWTHALFVGEPTGGRPSGYGDSRKITLPNSGLTVRAATIYWRDWSAAEDRASIDPGIPAALASADERHGRDPALEAALGFTARGLGPVVAEVARQGGAGAAALAYFRYRSDPWSARTDSERPLLDAARLLTGEGRTVEALAIVSLVAQDYPRSAKAFEALGDLYERLGRIEQAIESYEKALALDPASRPAAEALARLKSNKAGAKP